MLPQTPKLLLLQHQRLKQPPPAQPWTSWLPERLALGLGLPQPRLLFELLPNLGGWRDVAKLMTCKAVVVGWRNGYGGAGMAFALRQLGKIEAAGWGGHRVPCMASWGPT